MGISLRCRQAYVTQQFLDQAKIGTGIEHVGGKGVSEPVRRYGTHQAQLPHHFLKEPPHRTGRTLRPGASSTQLR